MLTVDRKPALADNLLLTLVAPDFVTIEILFYFGWKADVSERLQKVVDSKVEEFHRSQASKRD